jgi:dihydroorotate dehydrogenase electron transfer subunit
LKNLLNNQNTKNGIRKNIVVCSQEEALQKPLNVIGEVVENNMVSDSMYLLDIILEQNTSFLPGQFCMINWAEQPATLGRPLSILSCTGTKLHLLYKAVGRGTSRLALTGRGEKLELLTPLGVPFSEPDSETPRILIAGGVGLPPMLSWYQKYARPQDMLCFGGRDGGDIPWKLLPDNSLVSVDNNFDVPKEETVFHGNVIELLNTQKLPDKAVLFSCGPTPLLQAVKNFAIDRNWECFVSVEERMGCGYGVCRGCVIPTDSGYKTVCKDGPVFNASIIKLGEEL